jgi:ABC-type antimicrobial peptide transport system permease subunit
MTDMSTKAPITIRRLSLPRLGFRRLGIGASLASICGVMSDALKLAYVAPYTSLRRQPPIVPDEDLGGRDPTW